MVRTTNWQSEGEKNESESKSVYTQNPVTCCTSNKKSLHAWHGECTNNIVDKAIAMGVGKDDDPRTIVPLQDGSKTPFNRGSMNPVGAENRIRAYKELQRRMTHWIVPRWSLHWMGLIHLPNCFNVKENSKKKWRAELAWEGWCDRVQCARVGSIACDDARGNEFLKRIQNIQIGLRTGTIGPEKGIDPNGHA